MADHKKTVVKIMRMITELDVERVLPYWKPEQDKEYQTIVFTDWDLKKNNFGDEVLVLSTLQVNNIVFQKPKEFNSKSYSFITQIWPIIDRAQRENRAEIYVCLKFTGKKYILFDIIDHVKKQAEPKQRPAFFGVKVETTNNDTFGGSL